MNCDLCGKSDESLKRAVIESVELNVCPRCSKFGKIIGNLASHKIAPKKAAAAPKEEKVELLVENYAEIIRNKRESMGLSQKDFALRINEKESVVHKIETGHFEPQLAVAKRLGKILGIKLVEEHEEGHSPVEKKKYDGFTLGDFIKIK
ncbi:TIGR00270 family protein [Candidatus Woesearchaeota archaeon]|nr:TIGR00270 family protein [Candidatus Woesearchaeota archaeon]